MPLDMFQPLEISVAVLTNKLTFGWRFVAHAAGHTPQMFLE